MLKPRVFLIPGISFHLNLQYTNSKKKSKVRERKLLIHNPIHTLPTKKTPTYPTPNLFLLFEKDKKDSGGLESFHFSTKIETGRFAKNRKRRSITQV